MKLVIHEIPPTNNKYLGSSHNFNIYRREKLRWHMLVKAAIGKRPEKPLCKAVVTLRYFFPDRRRRDPDNYSGKMLLDPLVREGILADDSFSNVRLVIVGDYDKHDPRTEIYIREIKVNDKAN